MKKNCNNNKKKQSRKVYNWKVIKRMGNKLYVKWKGYDSSFNSWVLLINDWIFPKSKYLEEKLNWIRFIKLYNKGRFEKM